MKLTNFQISKPYGSAELLMSGHRFDLHNSYFFFSMNYIFGSNCISLESRICPTNVNSILDTCSSSVLKIVFEGVKNVHILSDVNFVKINSILYKSEYQCLSAVSKIVPGEGEYGFRDKWEESDKFNLFFQFQSGVSIEIDADLARLEY